MLLAFLAIKSRGQKHLAGVVHISAHFGVLAGLFIVAEKMVGIAKVINAYFADDRVCRLPHNLFIKLYCLRKHCLVASIAEKQGECKMRYQLMFIREFLDRFAHKRDIFLGFAVVQKPFAFGKIPVDSLLLAHLAHAQKVVNRYIIVARYCGD